MFPGARNDWFLVLIHFPILPLSLFVSLLSLVFSRTNGFRFPSIQASSCFCIASITFFHMVVCDVRVDTTASDKTVRWRNSSGLKISVLSRSSVTSSYTLQIFTTCTHRAFILLDLLQFLHSFKEFHLSWAFSVDVCQDSPQKLIVYGTYTEASHNFTVLHKPFACTTKVHRDLLVKSLQFHCKLIDFVFVAYYYSITRSILNVFLERQ